MNYDRNSNDGVLTMELRDALSELAIPEPDHHLTTITSRDRAHRHQRLAGFAGSARLTVAAAGTALALGLTAAPNAAPAPNTNAIRSHGPPTRTDPQPAFILTSNVNGTATLTLTMSRMLTPPRFSRRSRQRHPGPGQDRHLLHVHPRGARPRQCGGAIRPAACGSPHDGAGAQWAGAKRGQRWPPTPSTLIDPAALPLRDGAVLRLLQR